ncbi:PIN domain-like family protein [Euphorbia peplus]|nr:PIN domain-like family protein [Euphorbia peplus]
MRLKKQKRHHRAVRFYRTCFGFRQPFKVLCDGTFVHHLITYQIAPADKAVSNILSGPVKLFTTRAQKTRQKSYSESLQAAQQLMVARCDHEKIKSAEACIRDVIGESNSEHFFVATQDFELRKKFWEVPGVPLMYGLRNALLLEPPSSFQHKFVKKSEEERLHATEREYKLLKLRTKQDDSAGGNEDSSNQASEIPAVNMKHKAKRGMETKDKVQFKRKRAKGPNPLSCKKKKKDDNPKPSSSVKENNAGKDGARTRSRGKRKRSSKAPETAAHS